jgi:hypothetical protein
VVLSFWNRKPASNGRAHVDSLDGMASTNSTIQVVFLNCYQIQILTQFSRSLKNSIIQVVCFNSREWYIVKWAASRQKPASIALFTFLKVTGDQILTLLGTRRNVGVSFEVVLCSVHLPVLGGSYLFHSPTRASSYKTLGESAQFLEKE